MRYSSLLLALLSIPALTASAQTTHIVTVSNFQFNPAELTVAEGDSVVWQNVAGFHNVREDTVGTAVGFGNAPGSGWTYSFVFTEVGTYGYDCEIHPASMQGSVTVNPSSSTEEVPEAGYLLRPTGPNPTSAGTSFALTLGVTQRVRATVHDALGREVAVLHDGPAAAGRVVNLVWRPEADAADGVYVVRIEGASFGASRSVTLVRTAPPGHGEH